MLQRKAPEHQGGLDEVRHGVTGGGKRVDLAAQQPHRSHAQCPDQAVLRAEERVDGARRRAGVGRDQAERQSVHAFDSDSLLGGIEQSLGQLLVMLSGSAHSCQLTVTALP